MYLSSIKIMEICILLSYLKIDKVSVVFTLLTTKLSSNILCSESSQRGKMKTSKILIRVHSL
jgi:hypothetical protein